jgi:hypothetical protein
METRVPDSALVIYPNAGHGGVSGTWTTSSQQSSDISTVAVLHPDIT